MCRCATFALHLSGLRRTKHNTLVGLLHTQFAWFTSIKLMVIYNCSFMYITMCTNATNVMMVLGPLGFWLLVLLLIFWHLWYIVFIFQLVYLWSYIQPIHLWSLISSDNIYSTCLVHQVFNLSGPSCWNIFDLWHEH